MKWMHASTPLGSAHIPSSKDREIRTIHAAEIATTAFLGLYDVRRVITGGIESGRQRQDVGRAKLHTKPTAFTTFRGYRHKTFGHEEPSRDECGRCVCSPGSKERIGPDPCAKIPRCTRFETGFCEDVTIVVLGTVRVYLHPGDGAVRLGIVVRALLTVFVWRVTVFLTGVV